jgi:hypothetical protein
MTTIVLLAVFVATVYLLYDAYLVYKNDLIDHETKMKMYGKTMTGLLIEIFIAVFYFALTSDI